MDQAQLTAALQALLGGNAVVPGNDNQPRGIATDFEATVHNAVVCPTKLQDNSLVSGLYYPNLKKGDGTNVSKLVVICWNNSAFKNTPSSTFKVNFWGKYADIFARCLSLGQFIDLKLSIQHTFYDNPNAMENATVNGAQIQRPRRTYYEENRVTKCYLRQESAKAVAGEVANWPSPEQLQSVGGNWAQLIGGKVFFARPPQWAMAGSPDEAIWKQIRTMRTQATYVPGNQKFGYCAVVDKNGTPSAYAAPVAGSMPAVNPDLMATLMTQISAMNGGTPVTTPITTPVNTPVITPEMQALINTVANASGGNVAAAGGGSLNI